MAEVTRQYPVLDTEKLDYLGQKQPPTLAGNLARELASLAVNPEIRSDERDLWQALKNCWGKDPDQLKTLGEFYCTYVREAVTILIGHEGAERTKRLLSMRLNNIYSSSPTRRSYHSGSIGDQIGQMVSALFSAVVWPYYGLSPAEAARYDTSNMTGYMLHLALSIKEREPSTLDAVREAILGDNSEVLLTSQIIRAIIISEDTEMRDLLAKLLLAAKQQEGLRQQILENIDWASKDTILYFLHLIQDNKLTRFSSVIRAMNTWTGEGYELTRPALAEKRVQLAIDVLEDESSILRYACSDDALEVNYALWGSAVRDIHATHKLVDQLMEQGRTYQKVAALHFLYSADLPIYSAQVALQHLNEREDRVLAWILRILDVLNIRWRSYDWRRGGVDPEEAFPAGLQARKEIFRQLADIADIIGTKDKQIKDHLYPNLSVVYSSKPALSLMLRLTMACEDAWMLEELLKRWANLPTEVRTELISSTLLQPKQIPAHRKLLQDALGDRSSYVREKALARLSEDRMTEHDVARICDALSSRSSNYRKQLVTLLSKQETALTTFAVDRLLKEQDDQRLQGGLSLLLSLRKEHSELVNSFLPQLRCIDREKLSGQAQLLLEQLVCLGKEWTEENGFGLFDPKDACFQIEPPPQLSAATPKPGLLSRLFGKKTQQQSGVLSNFELRKRLDISDTEIINLFKRLEAVTRAHTDYEYEVENWDGSRRKVLFGNEVHPIAGSERHNPKLEDFPFWEELLEACEPYSSDPTALVCLLSKYNCFIYRLEPWFATWVVSVSGDFYKSHNPYRNSHELNLQSVLRAILRKKADHKLFNGIAQIYVSLMESLGRENWSKFYDGNPVEHRNSGIFFGGHPALSNHLLDHWRDKFRDYAVDDDDFTFMFKRLRYEMLSTGSKHQLLRFSDYLRAWKLGLIPEAVIYQQMTTAPDAFHTMKSLTNQRDYRYMERITKDYPEVAKWRDRVIDRVISVEAKRGELATPLSACSGGIQAFEGNEHFVTLLKAMGTDDFDRGASIYIPHNRKESLSHLIKCCRPEKGTSTEEIAGMLKEAGIKDERLAQVAMYAPQWAGILEKVTGWTGLKSGVWLFHAHINEYFSAEKETEVAIYSPVTPLQFNDGTFDKNWFMSVYNTLGEQRFHTLYRCAKYITSGSSQHRRSQLYTDAVLGRLDAEAMLSEIKEKRNQEKLRAWTLIPLRDEYDALSRYEYIRLFEKESRQFGAQRRDSEKKACRAALENLAITMGCADVDRMLWRLEGQKLEHIRPLMDPKEIGGVVLSLDIASNGAASIQITKNGKQQKTLPAALKKDEWVLKLKQTVKELTEQQRRARQSLENAMITASAFHRSELENLLSNPVLGPMVSSLLWRSDGIIGLPCTVKGSLFLSDVDGNHQPADENLYIVHPHDLVEQGIWAAWQRYVFQMQLVQPFKQIFREYYPLTAEERFERTHSRRYAGHQVQPKKGAALLRGRGWTVDYMGGLQKVCYGEELIVRIYAMADWFTPSEIEPPTLEVVRFYDRKTGNLRDLDTIPPITFSEAMRDLDLMVSVAHAGGVDPEASHSTVEMRAAIAGELLQLLNIQNVELLEHHAKISGSLGRYSVHMGSGVTHMEGKGNLVILPVHSQSRGRIFLPFADEDPKTAEIMSKILLLAADKKIKDPSILEQIGSGH